MARQLEEFWFVHSQTSMIVVTGCHQMLVRVGDGICYWIAGVVANYLGRRRFCWKRGRDAREREKGRVAAKTMLAIS